MNKRLGLIVITEKMNETFWLNNRWFVPLDIQIIRAGTTTYLCSSNMFNKLKEGSVVPQYLPEFKLEEDGQVNLIKCVKVND